MNKATSRSGRRRPYHTTAVIGGVAATIALVIALFLLTDWPALLLWLAAVNTTTFAMFGVDKAAAKANGPRIPEIVLHAFTLLGGFLGQLAGRLLFNHKTSFRRHPSFTIVLVVSAILWIGLAYLVLFRD
ncbi:MAG: DUF1294 domain-containing protein [Chloroflexota bacterium]|nr:MAG: DUF1294 domain-containing protein [Chloroflexota bacterium]